MKRRILVVAFSKQPGGAEKSAIKVAYSLMNSCFDFTKLATFKQSELDFYEVPQELPEVALFPNYNKLINSKLFGKKVFSFFLLPIDLYLNRRIIRNGRFDLVISFGAGVGCLMYLILFGFRIPQITSERISPDSKIYRPSLFARYMRPWIYRHGVVCSVQSEGFLQVARNLWGIEGFITPNHFELPLTSYRYTTNANACIAVGRPSYQKGYDILIDAWKLLENRVSNELWIVADDYNGYISTLISQKEVQRIKVMPLTNNLPGLYSRCSLYISTSRFEGFPNALAEAIIYGIPTLTTVSSDVVYDWCEKGLCLKIDSTEPMKVARAIEEALGRPEVLNQVSQRAIRQRKDFSWESAENAWNKIITAALNGRSYTS